MFFVEVKPFILIPFVKGCGVNRWTEYTFLNINSFLFYYKMCSFRNIFIIQHILNPVSVTYLEGYVGFFNKSCEQNAYTYEHYTHAVKILTLFLLQ